MSTANYAGRGKQRHRRGADRRSRRGDDGAPGQPVMLYGLHAASAALANPRREILAAFASANVAQKLEAALRARAISVQIETPQALSGRLGAEAVHQGIILQACPLKPVALEEVMPASPLIALDQVTDPRNLGAILRVGSAFAAGGLITTRRHRPAESGLIAKAASGGLEHVALVEVGNLARALAQAREAGYWIAGLDSQAEAAFDDVAGNQPLMIVLGSEGQGLRRLTREACDGLYRIALPGRIASLNVSTAAALALHTVSMAGD